MDISMKAWLNGILVDWREARVSPLSHSFNRASAVFEVMAVVPAANGPAVICLAEHVHRFFSSAEQVYMNLPYTPGQILDAVLATARSNRVENGVVKCYAYYPDLDLGPVAPHDVSVAVFCLDYTVLGVEPDKYAHPLCVGISSYRKLHPATAAVHAKITGNYTNGYLARTEVRRKGFDDALMLDTEGRIAEAPTANIFLVKDRCVRTPSDENVLPGITRKVVMDVLEDMKITTAQSPILPGDLSTFDEAFLSGTLRHVQPILRIEDHELDCPGPITRALVDRMHEVYLGRVKRFEGILTYIA